jgi:anti-anti-sigma regulatory factor
MVTATVTVAGRVDRAATDQVADRMRALVAAGVTELVIDVSSAVGDVDAALLTVLARARAELAVCGGTVRLTGVTLPRFAAALHTADLDEVFVVYDALRRDGGPPTAATSAQPLTRPAHPAVDHPVPLW